MNLKKISIIILMVLIGAIYFPANGLSETINWKPYNEAVKLSKQEGKKIFLHFFADWCGYCRKMNNVTFQDTAIVSYLNKNFVSVRVNSDKSPKLAFSYGVRGLPSTWFISEDNDNISNLPGYIDPERLLVILTYINQNKYKDMPFNVFFKSYKK